MVLWQPQQHRYRRVFLFFLIVVTIMTTTTTTDEVVVVVDALGMVDKKLTALANQHGLIDNPNRGKNILQPRHCKDFDQQQQQQEEENSKDDEDEVLLLFNEFGKAVCIANCIPRKELLETWAMAQYVHNYFPLSISKRVADLACGHGLLAYALLLLDTTNQRTAVCIDRRMPSYMEKVSQEITSRWPNVENRWDYVEGHVERIESSSSTVLLGIHCCGGLSDKVIELAISTNAPLALVPCCHTRKCLPPTVKKNIRSILKEANMTLAEFIDTDRIERLKQAGYTVEEKRIPSVITPKNHIILATPSPTTCTPCNGGSDAVKSSSSATPLLANLAFTASQKKYVIPVADTDEARAAVRSMAGRHAANLRRRKHPPSLGVSLWLPTLDALTLEQLNDLSNEVAAELLPKRTDNNESNGGNYARKKGNKTSDHYDDFDDIDVPVKTKTEYESEPYLNPNGVYSQTFKIYYEVDDDTGNAPQITRKHAKVIHDEVCKRIPTTFHNVTVRQWKQRDGPIELQ
jgi:hypothetical protein